MEVLKVFEFQTFDSFKKCVYQNIFGLVSAKHCLRSPLALKTLFLDSFSKKRFFETVVLKLLEET